MKILITGGSGFIGAWIARRLIAAGSQVRIFDKAVKKTLVELIVGPGAAAIEWVQGDVTVAADVANALAGCDGVIHLAGMLTPECKANPVLGAQVNLLGTVNVFEAVRHAGLKRVVYASTAGVFGRTDGQNPYPETLYGVYKFACEGFARVYWEDYRIASVGLRPLIVYGPGRGEGGASRGPTLACRAAARGQPYVMPYSGPSGLVYVDDVAAGFVGGLTAPGEGAHVFNMPGDVTTIDEVIASIRKVCPDAQISAEGDPLAITPYIEKGDLREKIPGLPYTPLDEGIAKTVAFYQQTTEG